MGALIVLWLLCGVVTAIIASNKGKNAVAWFFLGCILGIFGIILVAVLPSENATPVRIVNEWPREPEGHGPRPVDDRRFGAAPLSHSGVPAPRASVPALPPSPSYDAKKWQVLKEVDTEIGASAARVAAYGPKFEHELAEKYLTLNDKAYLQPIERQLVERAEQEKGRMDEAAALADAADVESSLKHLVSFEKQLEENGGRDPKSGLKVVKVEPYHGEWKMAKGGIKVTAEDGSVSLIKGTFHRRFSAGEEVS